MKISECIKSMPKLLKMGEPFVYVGEPGCGKSDALNYADQLGWRLLWFHPVVSDPTDFKGMPFAFMQGDQPKAKFLPFNDLEDLVTAQEKTLAVFDDLGQGPLAVQAAMMQLWLARRINGHRVSDNVVFAGATNRCEDKAAVAGMIEPLKSRCTLIPFETDLNDWCEWAYEKEWMPAEIPAFLRFKTELLSKFEPTRDMKNSPNPRNWARVGNLLHHGLDNHELIAGCVGEGAAAEFIAFKRIMDDLPNPDAILKDPAKAEVPDNKPAVMYALMGALSHRAKPSTAKALVHYLGRVPKEFSVLCMKDSLAKNKKNTAFRRHEAITDWSLDHAEVLCVAT